MTWSRYYDNTIKTESVEEEVKNEEIKESKNNSLTNRSFVTLTEGTIDQEVQKAEKDIEAAAVVSEKGRMETVLDQALKTARIQQRRGTGAYPNILFIGEAGTGKTSRIKQWCADNHINLLEIRCAGMDDTDFEGTAIGTNAAGKKALETIPATRFDALDRPNSVLFLDEFNRARASVRTNMLELVNDHVVPVPVSEEYPTGQRELKGFLFTIAAINPVSSRYNTQQMDSAELTRFRQIHVENEPSSLLAWLNKNYDKTLGELKDSTDELDIDIINEVQGQKALANALLTSPDFKFDSQADIDRNEEESSNYNGLPLNSRTFTNLLNGCDGTKKDFLDRWNEYTNNLKKPMADRILKNYVDVKDKANDALASGTESNVFAQKQQNAWDALSSKLGI